MDRDEAAAVNDPRNVPDITGEPMSRPVLPDITLPIQPPRNRQVTIDTTYLIRNLIAFGIPLGLLLLTAWSIVIWARDKPSLRYLNSPFPTRTTVVQGTPVEPNIYRCYDSADTFTITIRRLVNLDTGKAINLALSGSSGAVGCSEESDDVMVPLSAPPGSYVVEFSSRSAGVRRDFTVDARTQPFTVTLYEPPAPIVITVEGPPGPPGPEGPQGEPGESGGD